MKRILFIAVTLLLTTAVTAQVVYPYPSYSFSLTVEGKDLDMSYMDIVPALQDSNKTVVLIHGKNFNGFYWKEFIPLLVNAGYRVVVPDQVGWGKSSRANLHYSFHMLATNTKLLLDSLGIRRAIVLGHSMGGMLATRMALMYPALIDRLILENPIGLEDYKTFIPYQPIDSLFVKEKKATYASYKQYQRTYYPKWVPEYEQYVRAQAADLDNSNFENIAMINALTFQMIYEQPVVYELKNLKVPVLLIIGQSDRTVVGKDKLPQNLKSKYGNYPQLGRSTAKMIAGAALEEMEGLGHIPHVQATTPFWEVVNRWINNTKKPVNESPALPNLKKPY